MSTEDRINATGKNIEGKIQEAIGEVSGNPRDKAEGRAKQREAAAEHTVENIQDDAKEAIDRAYPSRSADKLH